jgi:small-conductance mechanosensitive channel
MESFFTLMVKIRDFLGAGLFTIGGARFSLLSVVYLAALLFLLFYISGKLRWWISHRLLSRSGMHVGQRLAIGTIARYIVLVMGFLVIIQTAGIDLTTLNVLAGALGIGMGFGLQNIVGNFISGLIILAERPIKIGDRIEVGGVEGDVSHIGARSTTVVTNDNIIIVIPNSKIVSENTVNWSHNDDKVRFRIPLSVAYGSDPRLVERLLVETAGNVPDVLGDPQPSVRFMGFGDSGLLFELRAWTDTLTHRKGLLVSKINFAIHDALRDNGIEVPFPQRDVHLRSGGVRGPRRKKAARRTVRERS